jgi:ribosomal-protein-alanine N-acetyltransferase
MRSTLEGRLCRVRPYRLQDVVPLQRLADDPLVARWMTRQFPSPYTRADAQGWVEMNVSDAGERHFAIEVDGIYAGGIGAEPCAGERTGMAYFGYWLGRPYWGRGIATEAARLLSDHVLRGLLIRRLEASVFAPNAASARVLEKAGFSHEGTLRAAYVDRNDEVCDALVFARVRPAAERPAESGVHSPIAP